MEKIHRTAKIGNAEVTLYKLSEGYEIIAQCLREGVEEVPPCSECSIRPRVCRWTVPEDVIIQD